MASKAQRVERLKAKSLGIISTKFANLRAMAAIPFRPNGSAPISVLGEFTLRVMA